MTDAPLAFISPGDPECWPTPSPGVNNTHPTYDPPSVTSLVPATAVIGSPDFTIHVHGSDFAVGAVILWNGAPEPTTRVSATELTTLVNMATATTPAAIPVSVQNRPGNVPSAPQTFTLTLT